MNSYDMETTIQLPDEEDVDVLIEFTVESWGSPGTGPSWNHPGDPPEGPEFDIIKITRDDSDEDITAKFDNLPDEWKQKVYDIVFEKICDMADDRDNYDYEG